MQLPGPPDPGPSPLNIVLQSIRPSLVASLLLLGVQVANAQVDCTVAAKQTLAAPDVAVVKKLLADQGPALKDADIAKSETARDAILKPLKCNQVSLDFRLQMSGPAFAELSKSVADAKDHVALNALRVFGELGTQQAVEAIKPALADAKRPAVRCMAAMSMRDIIRNAPNTGAIRDVNALLDVVAQRLEVETDVYVVENLVLALDATRDTPANPAAMQKMAVALAKQAKALRSRSDEANHDRWIRVLIRGTDGAFQPMLNAGAGTNLPTTFRTDAATLSGQALAYVRDRLSVGVETGSEQARLLSTLVNTSERALVLIDSAVRRTPVQKQVLVEKFDAAVESGDGTAFEADVDKWIGATGTLTKSPYTGKAADFAS